MTADDILTDDGRIDFETLRDEVGWWAETQFGTEQPAWYPAKGAMEEFGELVHSDLKRDQGIRLDEAGVGPDAERDAVGDIAIYLCDCLYRAGVEWGNMYGKNYPPTKDKALAEVVDDLSDVFTMAMNGCESKWLAHSAKEAIAGLRQYCHHKGYDFDKCVYEAWVGEVSDREWDANVAHEVADD